MKSFIDDLNKMVNTAQKIDRLLTEKPKRIRTKTISINFTEKELRMIYDWWAEADEVLHNKCNEDIITPVQLSENIKLFDKLRNERFKIK